MTHDLVITDGSPEWIPVADPEQWAAQAIKCRLLFFRGEYFLDVREGTPYYQVLLKKNVDREQVLSVIRQVISSVPYVATIDDLTLDINRNTRQATINWQVTLINQGTVRSEDFGPLVIEL